MWGWVSDRNQGLAALPPMIPWGLCASYPCNSGFCRLRGLHPQRGHSLARGHSNDAIELHTYCCHQDTLDSCARQVANWAGIVDQQEEIGPLAHHGSREESVECR